SSSFERQISEKLSELSALVEQEQLESERAKLAAATAGTKALKPTFQQELLGLQMQRIGYDIENLLRLRANSNLPLEEPRTGFPQGGMVHPQYSFGEGGPSILFTSLDVHNDILQFGIPLEDARALIHYGRQNPNNTYLFLIPLYEQ